MRRSCDGRRMSTEPHRSIARAVVGGAVLLVVALVAGAVAIATQTWPVLYVAGVVAVAGLVWLGFGLVARAVELGVRASRD
ncbi:hypothetical protein AERYTH_16605 [Aeromicrobium erythreum]|uniref:Uncharacterized protein n=2 Tax=Aeromicrobium erythreum TaxID=2041 RepID=A0A0U3T6A8_9ACTN|nr:hypothetical protein AERYTH_16605 [Aeromicrobium erythreum]